MIAKLVSVLIFSFVLFDLVFSNPIPFKDCGSTAKVQSLDINDCPKFPCILKKGQNYTMVLNFNSQSSSNSVKNKLFGVIAGIPVPFPIPEEDACKYGVNCPIQSGNAYTETFSIPVDKAYPSLSLYVKFELIDDNGKSLVCALFPAIVQN